MVGGFQQYINSEILGGFEGTTSSMVNSFIDKIQHIEQFWKKNSPTL